MSVHNTEFSVTEIIKVQIYELRTKRTQLQGCECFTRAQYFLGFLCSLLSNKCFASPGQVFSFYCSKILVFSLLDVSVYRVSPPHIPVDSLDGSVCTWCVSANEKEVMSQELKPLSISYLEKVLLLYHDGLNIISDKNVQKI